MKFFPEAFCETPNEYLEEITRKTNEIFSHHTMGDEVVMDVYLLRDLLNDSASGRFAGLSFKAWNHIAYALDYFLEVNDRIADTKREGLTDDLVELRRVMRNFAPCIQTYIRWRSARPQV